jgi:hypothetical protein
VKVRFGAGKVLSREELEADAAQAIEARVSLGRPPEEEFKPVEDRLAEVDAALAARPRLEPLPGPGVASPAPAGAGGGKPAK